MELINTLLTELEEIKFFKPGEICVIGCSTSEVIGERIGTHSSDVVAHVFYDAFKRVEERTGVKFCFQGCEHINRAITIDRNEAEKRKLEIVSVVPVKTAGGSMSAYAYSQMADPVVVEHIQADCGIDIGQTLIGMHVKHVQVPIRVQTKMVGRATVTVATHRPKLIGGTRARYELLI